MKAYRSLPEVRRGAAVPALAARDRRQRGTQPGPLRPAGDGADRPGRGLRRRGRRDASRPRSPRSRGSAPGPLTAALGALRARRAGGARLPVRARPGRGGDRGRARRAPRHRQVAHLAGAGPAASGLPEGARMSEHELTLALRALGRRLDAEPVADVAPVVLARIAERGRGAEPPSRPPARAGVRRAAADRGDRRRGLGPAARVAAGSGVDIQRVETLPPTVPAPATTRRPGRPPATASFARARARLAGRRGSGRGGARRRRCRSAPSSARRPRSSAPRRPTATPITLAWRPADPVLLTVVPAHDENDPFLIGKALTQDDDGRVRGAARRRRRRCTSPAHRTP